jgi:hypothetical protein
MLSTEFRERREQFKGIIWYGLSFTKMMLCGFPKLVVHHFSLEHVGMQIDYQILNEKKALSQEMLKLCAILDRELDVQPDGALGPTGTRISMVLDGTLYCLYVYPLGTKNDNGVPNKNYLFLLKSRLSITKLSS